MKATTYWALSTLLVIVAGNVVLFCACVDETALVAFYKANLRSNLFQVFFVIGGMLLALQAFIVVEMKKHVYDTKEYENHLASVRRASPKRKISHFGPLSRLNSLIFYSVGVCLLTSISQLTVGLSENLVCVSICLSLSAVSVSMLFACLVVIHKNLKSMFVYLEKSRESD